MTRIRCLLLALALAGSGCLSPLTHLEEAPVKPSPAPVTAAPPPPPVVTPDEVTEANAFEKACALARELDYAASERTAAPVKENTARP